MSLKRRPNKQSSILTFFKKAQMCETTKLSQKEHDSIFERDFLCSFYFKMNIVEHSREISDVTPSTDKASVIVQLDPAFGNNKFESNLQPIQPTLAEFPKRDQSKTKRRFNKKWYDQFPWLEYSCSQNKAFCYNCRIFGKRDGMLFEYWI